MSDETTEPCRGEQRSHNELGGALVHVQVEVFSAAATPPKGDEVTNFNVSAARLASD